MLIGILECGRLPPDLHGDFPDYPLAFERLLGQVHPDWRFRSYPALDDVLPESTRECDGWLITGSPAGAYYPEQWIRNLEAFVREVVAQRRPLVGICFGHQVIATALGGRVVKSERGWGVGVHRYELTPRARGFVQETRALAMQAFHQDQVVDLPPGAEVVASSEFCPVAAFELGDTVRTVQAHPEFDADFASALLVARRGAVVPEAVADSALATMRDETDALAVAKWLCGALAVADQATELA